MFKVAWLVGLLTLGGPAPALAQTRAYYGEEAQALQCAAYFSYTSLVLERRGLITQRRAQEGALQATTILGRHVSGTYSQKRKAFVAVLSQLPRAEGELIEESIRYYNWCSERFLG